MLDWPSTATSCLSSSDKIPHVDDTQTTLAIVESATGRATFNAAARPDWNHLA